MPLLSGFFRLKLEIRIECVADVVVRERDSYRLVLVYPKSEVLLDGRVVYPTFTGLVRIRRHLRHVRPLAVSTITILFCSLYSE